jgi:hypothetical protein
MVNWFKNLFRGKAKTEREAYLKEQEGIPTPWATFEIGGFEDDGRVKVMFHWNNAFIAKINELGFQAETEQDSVQLFFHAAGLRPTDLSGGDEPVQSESHPTLSGQQNQLKV